MQLTVAKLKSHIVYEVLYIKNSSIDKREQSSRRKIGVELEKIVLSSSYKSN